MNDAVPHRGRSVTLAATGINLALGVLYTWSIFKGAIRDSIEKGGPGAFAWPVESLNDPYALCCLVFAFSMIPAGRCQDRFGPRVTAATGGLLVGLGFLLISQSAAYGSWIAGFGILVGAGIAFGYSSATPAAMKWYPPTKTGMIAGIVVSGFGLASVYIAPLAKWLLGAWGLSGAMLFFGAAFFLAVGLLSFFLVNPPEGYVPPGFVERRSTDPAAIEKRKKYVPVNVPPGEMLCQPMFWVLWVLYGIGAGAGLMVIGSVAGMAKRSLGEAAFAAVAILAVGNAAGRIVAGALSDRIGRRQTLLLVFMFQAVLMFAAIPVTGKGTGAAALVLLATGIGFNYGANLALFPSFTKDLWGFRNFGVNYGIVFSAWGVGGFFMSRLSQTLAARTGSYASSFVVAGAMLAAGALLTLALRDRATEF